MRKELILTEDLMKKVKFVFGIHNHQPVGNFDFVFEDAYQKSYLPFLQVLNRHPKIRISLHFTGILLDWLEKHHPDLLHLVRKMTERGQLEIMSGAYYEPILSVIPREDRLGQIRKQTRRVKSLFGYEASGMWLAERIWEPDLPSTLFDADIRYTVIDDTHFKYAGLTDADLNGFYITEDNGKSVYLFPINKHLRYTIPFQDPQETIRILQERASEDGQTVIVFADDGEKFGVWPDTYQHVYENGWLDQFFSAVEQNSDWIEMLHFDEIVGEVMPKDKIYLPTASYSEMMHWSLFTPTFHLYEEFDTLLKDKNLLEKYGIFVRGGFWRNFMSKYPEVNVMHKKMLRVSRKLWALNAAQRRQVQPAFDHLWAGQCNCPYWHGVFGGLYLSHLRYAIFQNLIQAEKMADAIQKTEFPIVEHTDFDIDGQQELIIETSIHNVYLKPSSGATLLEYDFKPSDKNLLDTMTRREEGYHRKLADAVVVGKESEADNDDSAASIHDILRAKEPNLMDHLNYDWYQRKSFVDHILGHGTTLEEFTRARFREEGDFVNQPYEVKNITSTPKEVRIKFRRDGHVWVNGNHRPLTIQKTLTILEKEAAIMAEYTLINSGKEALELQFAVEFNFGLQAGHEDDRFYYDRDGRLDNSYLDSSGILTDHDFIALKDEYLRIDARLHSTREAEIWRMPVETISLSEAGFERVYQSSSVLFIWKISLEKRWSVQIDHLVKHLD